MMNITVLIENTTKDQDLACEHGLSLYIEYEGKKLLIDTGCSEAFAENAQKLHVDLGQVEYTMLSHGHYDHSSGYKLFLQMNEDAKLYAGATALGEYYGSSGGEIHYIGVPGSVKKKMKKRMTGVSETAKIADGVYAVPHTTGGLDEIGREKQLYCKCGEEYVGDDFSHEISYVFCTDKGLVIVNSCSHGGIGTILQEVHQEFPDEQMYAFIGGLHMKSFVKGVEGCTFTDEELDAFADTVRSYGLKHIYTGHCTGGVALDKLRDRLGETVQALATGMVIML